MGRNRVCGEPVLLSESVILSIDTKLADYNSNQQNPASTIANIIKAIKNAKRAIYVAQ